MPVHPKYPTIDTEGQITCTSKVVAFIFVILLPTIAVGAAIVLAYYGMVTVTDIGIFIGMYVATGFGTTVGYHRLFTHRGFETYRPIRWTLAILGCMNAQGSPIIWATQHRKHHAFSDQEGDPHSPNFGRRPGFFGAIAALWHSHYGHVFNQIGPIEPEKYAPDLAKDPLFRWMEKWGGVVVILGILIPAAIGYAATETWSGAATGLLWGGFVRLFAITHATGSVNSLCHFFGAQRFNVNDKSRNVAVLVPATLGESWHNNHHAFPTSARHGLRWWELDPSWMLIWGLEFWGLVWAVVKISPERQRERAAK